jgi:two-component system, NarL family, invasion response regulator UvrY
MKKKIEILLVDDHAVVRAGLRRILEGAGDMSVKGEASRGEEAVEMIEQKRYDVVVLDLDMPGRGGMDALKEMRRRQPELAVLILSMYPEDQYGPRALRVGASGYVMKERPPEEMVLAVRKVAGGGTHISPALAERLASDLSRGGSGRAHEKLSDREDQILRLLVNGLQVKDIAQRLSLGDKTVSEYKRRILRKLKLKNLAGIIRYALDNKLTGNV